nr:unnamed protein product [Callosobruchus analis]
MERFKNGSGFLDQPYSGEENSVPVQLLDPENPIELAFQGFYGLIVNYKWYGDGYILIGFSNGYFISISTHIKEVGQELFQIRNHKNSLTDITINNVIGKAASCGDNTVKIHDLSNLKETSTVLNLSHEAGVDQIRWSNDGQLLAVCTKGGSLNVYVSYMPLLTSVCPPRIAMLSSLTEVSLYNYTSDKSKLKAIPVTLEVEPSFLAVGPYHLAAGMNNNVWFYDLTKSQPGVEDLPLKLKSKQYLGTVSSIKLNAEYASVLFDGKVFLHMIEPSETSQEDRESILFPDDDNETMVITCHELTADFLVYATDMGHIIYFHMEDWARALEYRHAIGITSIFVDLAGTRLIFLDIKTKGYIFNAVLNEIIPIPDLPAKTYGITWDSNINDRNIFIAYDDHEICTYAYIDNSVDESWTNFLVSKQIPLLMYAGEVMSASSGGQLTQILLSTHDSMQIGIMDKDQTIVETNFNKQLNLLRFSTAFSTCTTLKSKACLNKLAEEAMKHLEIETAIRAYKELEQVHMVWNLEGLLEVEEKKLLCGYVNMFLQRYDRAQEWFLKSSEPVAALDMRRDLLQWDQALQLANKMAPEQVALISREHYEKALQENLSPEHTFTCKAGIARTNLHCGNYRHGMSIAVELDNKQLLRECAEILDKRKQLAEAAILFEKFGELLPNVNSSKIHLQYAKAKESEKNYTEAVAAYEKAKDFDSVIRLHLEHLNNPEIAVELVQETKSVDGAKMVAKFFLGLNDITSAIKFLVLSKCSEEALDLAKRSGKMQLYGEILLDTFTEDEIKPHDFINVATHFEGERNYLLAGKYWFHAREYHKAMKHLLKAAKSNANEKEALTSAIDVVASSDDESLANTLIEFLLGETDGFPKDPKYLFRLYMARKQFRDASKSALIIANEEQASTIDFLLFYIISSLCSADLDSSVIECHRAGLRQAAYKYATMLMNPEYRKNIDSKYSKKIEAVVRKPPKSSKDGEPVRDPVESLSPCPYCENMLPDTEGRHIVSSDLTACPECDFPALRSEFVEILEAEPQCPMCSEKIDPRRLTKIENIDAYLRLE